MLNTNVPSNLILKQKLLRVNFSQSKYPSYQETIKALFKHQSVKAKLTELQLNTHNTQEELAHFTRALDLQQVLARIPTLHVAGTKGKGSTCSFISRILQSIGLKTGLSTSPHLVSVRERIQINNEPINEQDFTSLYWRIREQIEKSKTDRYKMLPSFFRFVTMMSFQHFWESSVDAMVIEVGIGGRFDATNIVSPDVCTITSLGMDHLNKLGGSLEQIAWHKAGIMKPGVHCFTVPQKHEAAKVLKKVSKQVGAKLSVPRPIDQMVKIWESSTRIQSVRQMYQNGKSLALSLQGEHQKINATAALHTVVEFLSRRYGVIDDLFGIAPDNRPSQIPCMKTIGKQNTYTQNWISAQQQEQHRQQLVNRNKEKFQLHKLLYKLPISTLMPQIIKGLETTKWDGRCQLIKESNPKNSTNINWFLDGAHTTSSINYAIKWFTGIINDQPLEQKQNSTNILIFNCIGDREIENLLEPLSKLNIFKNVIFSPNLIKKAWHLDKDLQQLISQIWKQLDGKGEISVTDSLQKTLLLVDQLTSKKENVNIFVTGSLHLVGGIMKLRRLKKI
ncbi:folylpolyglutamate synthase [Anaeramoeba flamelloides]|uniref:tetrahydrofolate synthase n=1 Tax=Anaeramoeba flamelloides TaxID=1746091 RepID=A0AAV8A119_9EUKA|nr:folylpolyglutamate synthase [Anaeramoeba flamelloides]